MWYIGMNIHLSELSIIINVFTLIFRKHILFFFYLLNKTYHFKIFILLYFKVLNTFLLQNSLRLGCLCRLYTAENHCEKYGQLSVGDFISAWALRNINHLLTGFLAHLLHLNYGREVCKIELIVSWSLLCFFQNFVFQ